MKLSPKHDPHCDCGICAYCNGQEDIWGNKKSDAAIRQVQPQEAPDKLWMSYDPELEVWFQSSEPPGCYRDKEVTEPPTLYVRADLPRATEGELTVEACLAELREMFPDELIRIEIHTGYIKIVVGWRGTSHPSLDVCMKVARHRWAKSAASEKHGKSKHPSGMDLIQAASLAARFANTELNANPLYVKALIEIVEILETAAAMGRLNEVRTWAKSRDKGEKS